MRKASAADVTNRPARHWHAVAAHEVQCDVCPRLCRVVEGHAGQCGVRACRGGQLVATTYGRGTGFRLDPVERSGFFHVLPGSPVLSFGTSGCNLGCRFCTNPLVRPPQRARVVQQWVTPVFVGHAARHLGARAVGFGASDPVVFPEFAIDVATAAREAGLKVVTRTAGYVEPGPRAELFGALDAVALQVQAFRDGFYERVCGAHLQPVLETAAWIRHQSRAWLELSYRLVPGENDSERELDDYTSWAVSQLGVDVPLHFVVAASEMTFGAGRASLERARLHASANGVRHVYLKAGQAVVEGSVDCAACGLRLVEREGTRVRLTGLDAAGRCRCCGAASPGIHEEAAAAVAAAS